MVEAAFFRFLPACLESAKYESRFLSGFFQVHSRNAEEQGGRFLVGLFQAFNWGGFIVPTSPTLLSHKTVHTTFSSTGSCPPPPPPPPPAPPQLHPKPPGKPPNKNGEMGVQHAKVCSRTVAFLVASRNPRVSSREASGHMQLLDSPQKKTIQKGNNAKRPKG